ncbi:MAG: hypothetical protein LC660_03595 [Desulfobacteraceae bacterium]|nr:hypothetical protein [Desulfobacteraceae bacterium]
MIQKSIKRQNIESDFVWVQGKVQENPILSFPHHFDGGVLNRPTSPVINPAIQMSENKSDKMQIL